MQRAFNTILASAALALTVAGPVFAHDVAHPLTLFEPNAKVERAAHAFHQKVLAAKAAGVPATALQTARFVAFSDLTWPTHNITVCFWNGTSELQDFVMQKARVWSDAANLHFIYKTNGKNNICQDSTSAFLRINLDPGATELFPDDASAIKGDWSYIGRYALNTKLLVTINLPGVVRLRDRDPMWTTHAIRHEFGHALALMHEHQRALCDPWFDYQKISKMTGWTVAFAKSQIGRFPNSELPELEAVGSYDQKSIMQYNFAKDEFIQIPGKTNPCYRARPIDNLSKGDITGIRVLYGTPGDSIGSQRRNGAEIPASMPDSAVAAARASLGKLDTMMQAEAAGRSGKSPEKAKRVAAAFGDVVAALKDFESVVPPR